MHALHLCQNLFAKSLLATPGAVGVCLITIGTQGPISPAGNLVGIVGDAKEFSTTLEVDMILVLGSTGNTGGEVARQLIDGGQKPRLLVRSKGKAGKFSGKADIVEGDLSDGASLAAAMKGVKKLYLVSAGLDGIDLEIKAIDAAKNAGVEHVVKLSVLGADAPTLAILKWHVRSEQHLLQSGLGWTLLRPGNFMSNCLRWADTIKTQGVFYQPTGEGRWAAIDPVDIGAAAVAALTKPGHANKAYNLTGPEALNGAQYADKLAATLGRAVKFVDVTPAAAKDGMAKTGMPPAHVDALLELFASMKADAWNKVTDGVEQACGRKAGRFEDWVKRNAAAFTG